MTIQKRNNLVDVLKFINSEEERIIQIKEVQDFTKILQENFSKYLGEEESASEITAENSPELFEIILSSLQTHTAEMTQMFMSGIVPSDDHLNFINGISSRLQENVTL